MDRFVILSGCSGGGKSTLLEALKRRGHQAIEEPGRRIVVEELESGGSALPWVDAPAFARRAIAMSLADREKAIAFPGIVFFDRGLIDAASSRAFDGRARAGCTRSTAPLQQACLPDPAMAGNLCRRSRKKARFYGGGCGIRPIDRRLSRARL